MMKFFQDSLAKQLYDALKLPKSPEVPWETLPLGRGTLEARPHTTDAADYATVVLACPAAAAWIKPVGQLGLATATMLSTSS